MCNFFLWHGYKGKRDKDREMKNIGKRDKNGHMKIKGKQDTDKTDEL